MFDLFGAGTAINPLETGHFRLFEQRDYVLRLHDPAADAFLAAEGHAICEPLGPGLWRLNAANSVGWLTVLGQRIEITSRKLVGLDQAFQAMLDDIVDVAGSLPFAFNTPVLQPLAVAERGTPILYHQWVILRAWWRGVGGMSLEEALAVILHDPHRRLYEERVVTDPFHTSKAGPATWIDLASDPAAWKAVEAPSPLAASPIGRLTARLSGRPLFPTRVVTSRPAISLDTAENRFVLYVLRMAEQVNLAFARHVAEQADCPNPGLKADCAAIRQALTQALQQSLFATVGEMTQLPTQSLVLVRREGYRQFFGGYLRLLAATEFPVADHDLQLMLEAKDIATLYEYWTYFAVVRAVSILLGPSDQAMLVRQDHVQATVQRETRVIWKLEKDTITCSYNRSFLGSAAGGSYSVTMRPDIVLSIGDRHWLFDAKFKLRHLDGPAGEALTEAKHEDIHKMHAYRDAIAGVQGAFVLYPGERPHRYVTPDGQRGEGVGAIPLRPGNDADFTALVSFLGALLRT